MGNVVLAQIDNSDTLGACMGRIYRHVNKNANCLRPVRISQVDWPRSARSFVEALSRIGSPVWFVSRFPSGSVVYVVARLDPRAQVVELTPATTDEAKQHQAAKLFNCLGVRLRS